eukprot:7007756-Prymnesium_polylepis.1
MSRDPSVKVDMAYMLEGMQLFFKHSDVKQSRRIFDVMYSIQPDLLEQDPDEESMAPFRKAYQDAAFKVKRRPLKVLEDTSQTHPAYTVSTLLRNPTFVAMTQKPDAPLPAGTPDVLADSVRETRKKFDSMILACTAVQDEENAGNGTPDRDLFFSAIDHILIFGHSYSVFIPNRMNVANSMKELLSAASISKVIMTVFANYFKLGHHMLQHVFKELDTTYDDDESRQITEFVYHSLVKSTWTEVSKAFTSGTIPIEVQKDVGKAFIQEMIDMMQVRPSIEDGPAGDSDVSGNKARYDSYKDTTIDFSPWKSAVEKHDQQVGVNKRQKILYVAYIKMFFRVLRRKKSGTDMWFGTSALGVSSFVCLYNAIAWEVVPEALDADAANAAFKTAIDNQLERFKLLERDAEMADSSEPAAPAPPEAGPSEPVAPQVQTVQVPNAPQVMQIFQDLERAPPAEEPVARPTRSTMAQRYAEEQVVATTEIAAVGGLMTTMSPEAASDVQSNANKTRVQQGARDLSKKLVVAINAFQTELEAQEKTNTLKTDVIAKAQQAMLALDAKLDETTALLSKAEDNKTLSDREISDLTDMASRLAARTPSCRCARAGGSRG